MIGARTSLFFAIALAACATREPISKRDAAAGSALSSRPPIAGAPSHDVDDVAPGALAEDQGSALDAARVEDLDVPGYLPSVLVLPARQSHAPVVVVAHGAGGRPEAHCDFYRHLVRGRGFILCTRGRSLDRHLPASDRGYFYDGHLELGKELRASLTALEQKFGDRVDLEHTIYAGFSQGAGMGALALQQGGAAPARIQGVLIVEGGWREWNIALSKKLGDEGVRRVAIVCGQTICRTEGDRSVDWIRRGGPEARMLHAPGAGHTYGGAVAPLVAEAWRWIVEGEPSWAAP